MTDAINPLSRQVPTDTLARKAMEKSTKAATLAPSSLGVALPPETEVAANKSVAAAKGAEVAGFGAIKARLQQEPDFDRVKVDSIKQAIESGQYPLNPRRIAESFVALVRTAFALPAVVATGLPAAPFLRRRRGRNPMRLSTMLTWGEETSIPCFLSVAMIVTGRGFSPPVFIAVATLRISADLFTSLESFALGPLAAG